MNSKAVNDKSFVNYSIRIFFIRIFNTIATLVVMLYFSHHLSQNEYGTYQNFWIQLSLLAPLAGMGLGMFSFTYTSDVLHQILKKLKGRHYFFYFSFLLILAAIFALLRINASEKIIAYVFLCFFFFLCYTISFLLETIVTTLHKHSILILGNLLYATGFIVIGFWCYYRGFSMFSFVLSITVITLLKLLLLSIPVFKFIQSPTKENDGNHINISAARKLWIHLAFYDMLSIVVLWIDKFLVSIVADEKQSALYANGSFNLPFIPILLSAVSSALLIKLNVDDTSIEKAKLVRDAGKFLSTFIYPLFFFLLIFRVEFLEVVFSAKYVAASAIFFCSLLVLPVRAYSNTTLLQHLHKGKIINIGIVLDLAVASILIYPLYILWGFAGIALSFVISTYVQVGYYLYHSAKSLHVPVFTLLPLKNWLAKAIFFAILNYALYKIFAVFNLENAFYKLLFAFTILLIVSGVYFYFENYHRRRTA